MLASPQRNNISPGAACAAAQGGIAGAGSNASSTNSRHMKAEPLRKSRSAAAPGGWPCTAEKTAARRRRRRPTRSAQPERETCGQSQRTYLGAAPARLVASPEQPRSTVPEEPG